MVRWFSHSVLILALLTQVACSGIIGFNRQAAAQAEEQARVWHLRPAIKNRNCYIEGGQRGLEIEVEDFSRILEEQLKQSQIALQSTPVGDLPLSQLLITQSCSPRENQAAKEDQGQLSAMLSTLASPVIYRDLYVIDAEVWLEGKQLRTYHIEVPYQQFLSVWTGTVQAFFMGADARENVNLKKGRALAREGIKRLVSALREDKELAELLNGQLQSPVTESET